MPILNNAQLMRQIIMDHYQNPRNKRTPDDLTKYEKIHMDSASCVDDFWFYLQVGTNQEILDVAFDGVGCTISIAASSIMSELLIGTDINHARYIIDQYRQMIHNQPFDETVLGDAIVFINTAKQPARISCATVGYDGISRIFSELEEKNHHHE